MHTTGRMPKTLLTRAAFVALTATLLWLLAASPATSVTADAAAERRGCAHAGASANEATRAQLERAMHCLINRVRAKRDRRKLKSNPALRGVARRHTRVMIETECLGHECPGERPLRERIEQSGYLTPGDRYGFGENTGYGETPADVFEAWMGTGFHRSNMLGRRYRHVGIGARRGTPDRPCPYTDGCITYTAIFAWRKRD